MSKLSLRGASMTVFLIPWCGSGLSLRTGVPAGLGGVGLGLLTFLSASPMALWLGTLSPPLSRLGLKSPPE
jgi:hypothetical protein